MDRLTEIAQERAILIDKVSALNAEKYELLLKKNNIVIGMLVEDNKGNVYKVTGARYLDDYGKPWVKGDLRRKDGSFGVNRTVYDWKKI